jgi:hypothetical protein
LGKYKELENETKLEELDDKQDDLRIFGRLFRRHKCLEDISLPVKKEILLK